MNLLSPLLALILFFNQGFARKVDASTILTRETKIQQLIGSWNQASNVIQFIEASALKSEAKNRLRNFANKNSLAKIKTPAAEYDTAKKRYSFDYQGTKHYFWVLEESPVYILFDGNGFYNITPATSLKEILEPPKVKTSLLWNFLVPRAEAQYNLGFGLPFQQQQNTSKSKGPSLGKLFAIFLGVGALTAVTFPWIKKALIPVFPSLDPEAKRKNIEAINVAEKFYLEKAGGLATGDTKITGISCEKEGESSRLALIRFAKAGGGEDVFGEFGGSALDLDKATNDPATKERLAIANDCCMKYPCIRALAVSITNGGLADFDAIRTDMGVSKEDLRKPGTK
jgi:hypothetical protein